MPAKKKQHFVPQFYLRFFSPDENIKSIGLFNIHNLIFKSAVRMDTQAYIDYFYGKDGIVENGLEQYETIHAPILREIINKNSLPKKYSKEYVELVRFISLMDLRNPESADYIHQSANIIMQELLKRHDKFKDFAEDYEMVFNSAIQFSLSREQKSLLYFGDLKFKVIENHSNIPFITSDNPLIKYNQYYESKSIHTGATGLACNGIQLFFALSPEKMLIIYDPWIYKVGDNNSNIIITKNASDIYQLNLLQFLKCTNTLFFKNVEEKYVKKIFEKSKQYQKEDIIKNEFKSDGSTFISLSKSYCRINLSLSFIKVKSKAHNLKLVYKSNLYRPFCLELMRHEEEEKNAKANVK